jgi:hypothetical protein
MDPAEQFRHLATETQLRYLDAVKEHGNRQLASLALGLNKGAISERLLCLERKAARLGEAPGHFESGVAPGYLMGKVTVQRGADGAVERTWERQSPDSELQKAALDQAVKAMADDLPRVDRQPIPPPCDINLLNLYTLTDCHVGMLAWHKEGGADWDLRIAEETLVGAFRHMVMRSPPAEVAIVNQLGDFLHFDGLEAVTPTNRHALDADGRFGKITRVAVRILRQVINIALANHQRVHVVCAEGNHDLASSTWLAVLLDAVYENEPRVTIEGSPLPFYRYRHGKTLLGFHHGHTKDRASLPLLFAQQFRQDWGQTEHTYIHTGHRHHMDEKDSMGVRLVQHATLAARDAYAARHGYHAARQAFAITYHSEFGEWGRATITPEMLKSAA